MTRNAGRALSLSASCCQIIIFLAELRRHSSRNYQSSIYRRLNLSDRLCLDAGDVRDDVTWRSFACSSLFAPRTFFPSQRTEHEHPPTARRLISQKSPASPYMSTHPVVFRPFWLTLPRCLAHSSSLAPKRILFDLLAIWTDC